VKRCSSHWPAGVSVKPSSAYTIFLSAMLHFVWHHSNLKCLPRAAL
jgi:hypothetical protein